MEYKDFLNMLAKKKQIDNSFIYFDPPYLPEEKSINQKQSLYTKEEFNHNDFFEFIYNIKKARYAVSMIDSNRANVVYGKLKKKFVADIVRTINPKKIFTSREVLFSNYNI